MVDQISKIELRFGHRAYSELPVMLIFLDTEFTDFERSDLISLALISEDGREFYAERTDYHRDACSEFVHETVQPLLGRVPGAACNRSELTERLHAWFEQLQEPVTIVFDLQGDWLLLVDAIHGRTSRSSPVNFGKPLLLSNSCITHPEFERVQNNTYTQDYPPHHALADARALMAGYRAWHALMEKSG